MKSDSRVFDINKMPRSRKAWEAAISLLNDGKHHYCLDVMHIMLEVSDIKPHSVSGLIRTMITQEIIREDPTGRWLFRPQVLPIKREWEDVYPPYGGVHTKQKETRNNEDLPTP